MDSGSTTIRCIHLPLETSLPPRVQEQFEQAIRDAITEIYRGEDEVTRVVPESWQREECLNLESIPALDAIAVENGPTDERSLFVQVYFASNEEVLENVTDEPLYLSDVGGAYADLSESIIETLVVYCDAPRQRTAEVFVTEQADLQADIAPAGGEFAVFSTEIGYPEYVERIYGQGDAATANNLRLPF